MIKDFEKYKRITFGVNCNGILNNFTSSFFVVYKKYFPDKKFSTSVDDWFFYEKLDYNGQNPKEWFFEKKAEMFDYSKPYPGSIENLQRIYKYIKSINGTLYIITNQPTLNSKLKCIEWLLSNNATHDGVMFIPEKEKFTQCDILVDDSEYVLKYQTDDKVSIKVNHPYNKEIKSDFDADTFRQVTLTMIKDAIKLLNIKQNGK